jgi:acyl-CoA synthetase (AMP-forming)/AMP-acid ligase II
VEVRDELGHVLPERRVGCVFARGPSLMKEFFGDAAATARALAPDGWLDTGDLGFVADGELYLTGRAKDLVIIRGANHAPQAFEECLQAVEGVRVGCAVALGFTPEGSEDEALLLLAERAAKGGGKKKRAPAKKVATKKETKPKKAAAKKKAPAKKAATKA